MPVPIHQERHMRIVCIGAGLSGLCFAYKLRRSFNDFSLTIFEKNEGIGGVWFENTYPGCACDYPAHSYVYSFAPKADYSKAYAGAQEIRGYFEDFAGKNNLRQYIRSQHQVTSAQWNARTAVWEVEALDLSSNKSTQVTCDILINACGALNDWKMPEVKGLDTFQGPLMHTAKWDSEVVLDGKSVGIIGNGSSAQQVTPAIQPQVGSLTTFIRQPSWILGPFGEKPREYNSNEIEEWTKDPKSLLAKRKEFETKVNTYFGVCFKDSPQQAGMRKHIAEAMAAKIPDAKLQQTLIPDYAIGCRRPTPGVDYIESLTATNSQVIVGQIREITETGVIDSNGQLHTLDVLVCATGFNTTYRPRFPLIGEDGVNLQDTWAKTPRAYLATAAPGCPNYMMFYGPSNPFASGPFMATVEAQADYMLKWCDRWQTEHISAFAPKQEAVDDFYAYAAPLLDRLVWTDSCHSWYKEAGADGTGVRLWPGSGLHYLEAIKELRAEDWHVRTRGNRWTFLGEGFSQTELDPHSDKGYYLDVADNSAFLSRAKRRKIETKSGLDDGTAAMGDGAASFAGFGEA